LYWISRRDGGAQVSTEQAASAASIVIERVHFAHAQQAAALRRLMQCYATDPMGGGTPIPAAVLQVLPERLAALPQAVSFFALVADEPVGLINCFEGFSTFLARPLLNIHDVVVQPDHRGLGISTRLLEAAEDEARRRGCCKLTLEVLTGNMPAAASYRRYGFVPYRLDPATGVAEFWQKALY
jgi:GNAT superfamily N-acetyltransferase